jgi:hypothetical protein
MLKKTALIRTDEFLEISQVKKILPSDFALSDQQRNSLMEFWSNWLEDNPEKLPIQAVYSQLCRFILGGQTDFYATHQKLKTFKPQSLEHTKLLYGSLWQDKWNSLVQKKAICKKTTEQLSRDFFKRSYVKKHLNTQLLDDKILDEVKQLFHNFDLQVINNNIGLVCDLIKYYQPDLVSRMNTCRNNSPNSREYLTARYAGNQNLIDSLSQRRQQQRRRNLKSTLDYWLNQCFDLDTATQMRNQHQRGLLYKAREVMALSPEKMAFKLDYWINKGLTETQAKEVLAQKNLRDLAFFMDRYGNDLGILKYSQMIQKRKDTFDNKPPEVKERINKSKGKTFQQLVDKHGHDKAYEIIASRCHLPDTVSRESCVFFKKLDLMLGDLSALSVTGYKGNERWVLSDGKIYFVDYFLHGKVIEYYGSFWHADPRLFESADIHPVMKKTVSEIWLADKHRIDAIEKTGYSCLTVWSLNVLNNIDQELHRCFKFLIGDK